MRYRTRDCESFGAVAARSGSKRRSRPPRLGEVRLRFDWQRCNVPHREAGSVGVARVRDGKASLEAGRCGKRNFWELQGNVAVRAEVENRRCWALHASACCSTESTSSVRHLKGGNADETSWERAVRRLCPVPLRHDRSGGIATSGVGGFRGPGWRAA